MYNTSTMPATKSILLESVEDIRDSAIDPALCGLATLLRKCRVVAARLQNKFLGDWIRFESGGYPKDASVPDYRITTLGLKGMFEGNFRRMENAPIPPSFVPQWAREIIQHHKIRSSVAFLEGQMKGAKEAKGVIVIELSILVPFIKMYEGMTCLQVQGSFGAGMYTEILNTVRNRILEFALAIEEEIGVSGGGLLSGSPASKEKVNQMVQTNIYGGNIAIIGGTNNAVNLYQVATGDFNSLSKALVEKGIPEEDITALRDALNSDLKSADGKFTPKVEEWINKMIGKAKDGVWDIPVQMATTFLTESLKQFLGF